MFKKLFASKLIIILSLVAIIFFLCTQVIPHVTAWSNKSKALAKSVQQKTGGMKSEVSISLNAANNPRISMADGRDVLTEYIGSQQAVEALQNDRVDPLALVSDDFDKDGVKDLVAAYAANTGGLLTIYKGNRDWLYPYAPETRKHKEAGVFTDSPFLSEAHVLGITEKPDFIGAGDFNRDGNRDLVVASRQDNVLLFLLGDGKGNFSVGNRITLPGFVTALRCGDVNRRDGLQDIVVAVWGGDGAKVMVFESPEGAIKAKPEIFSLPAQASDLLLENVDGDYPIDIVVAAGKDLLIISGRDRKLRLGAEQQAQVEAAIILRQRMSSPIRSLTYGDFNTEQGRELALLTEDGSIEIIGRTGGAGRTAIFSRRTLEVGTYRTASKILSSRVSDELNNNIAVLDGVSRQLHLISSGMISGGRKKDKGDLTYHAEAVGELNLNEEPVAVLPIRLNADPLSDLVILRKGQSAITVVPSSPQATFTVTNTGDNGGIDPAPGAGTGTLRQAIVDANAASGFDQIDFNIPEGGAQTINLAAALPDISQGVFINGASQPGYSGLPIIAISGAGAGTVTAGFIINASSQMGGLVIQNMQGSAPNGNGIQIGAGAGETSIVNCYIGTNLAGSAAAANGGYGIDIEGTSTLTIGGVLSSEANLISGNSAEGVHVANAASMVSIVGNSIGTNANSDSAIPNSGSGGVRFTGASTGDVDSNLISGNIGNGVTIDSNSNGVTLSFTRIGTNGSGTADLGNSLNGVSITGSTGTTVGFIGEGSAGNLISGNNASGVAVGIGGDTTSIESNFIGVDNEGAAVLGNTNNGVLVTNGATNVSILSNVISGNTNGIQIGTAGNPTNGNFIRQNLIGTNSVGNVAIPNTGYGVYILDSSTNAIGGIQSGQGNLISGNGLYGIAIETQTTTATANSITGNQIGISSGFTALPNTLGGILINNATNTQIGGTLPTVLNIISGNTGPGINITNGSTGNVVEGNAIGTLGPSAFNSRRVTAAVPNTIGVSITNSSNNRVGGTSAGSGNFISGNTDTGVQIGGSGTGNLVQGNTIGIDETGVATPNNFGVTLTGSGSTVGGTSTAARNLISGNTASGIFLGGTNNSIQGNYIGTDGAGTGAVPNGNGITVFANSTNNTIGGTASGAGNVISGNNVGILMQGSGVTGNQVQGNFIGTVASGLAALPNSIGITIDQGASTNTVGGTASGARNVISGNSGDGILLQSTGTTGNTIQGNYIGLKADGSGALPNANGVHMQVGTTGNTVGGTASGAGNVISGNSSSGVSIIGTDVSGNIIQGNLIGTDPTGATAIGNSSGVQISDSPNNTIGGTSATARNIISGNSSVGISIFGGNANLIQGNFIGTNAAGSAALANGSSGVTISASDNNAIGGAAAGSGNLISGNGGQGINIGDGKSTPTGNSIKGNLIGTNLAGTAAIANGGSGVSLSATANTIVGGTTASERNLISGNTGNGISLALSTTATQIQGNLIGTNAAGTSAIANGVDGVNFNFNANTNLVGGTTAGTSNIIAFNIGRGVNVINGTGNRILGNSIFSNGSLGIDLGNDGITANDSGDGDTGPNNLQNFPVLTSAQVSGGNTTIMGTLNSVASESFRLEFFSNPTCDGSGNGEGQVFIGTTNVTTDGSGNATINVSFPVVLAAGQVVTATATRNSTNDTSEFSACQSVNVVTNNPPTIMAAGPLSRQQGSPATNSQIATVSDPDQPANTLVVIATPATGTGVTVAGIVVDPSGNVTANVAASCTATNSTFTLTVTDNMNATATATLVVNVTVNTPPTLTYPSASVAFGGSTNVSPTTNTDNGSISGYSIQSVVPALTTPPNVNSSGVVSITNAAPAGDHMITVRATDNCGAFTDAAFTLTVGAPACVPLPANAISWYRAENNVNDQLGINNGTLQNGATFAAGKVGQAFSFDGVDDQVVVPHSASQNPGSQITIEAWVNPSTAGHGRPIAQKRSVANVGGYTFETTNSPQGPDNGLAWVIWIGGVPRTLLTPANVLTLNTFQHVAATYDGSTMKIYVNGVLQASQSVTGAIDAVTDPFVIGRNVVNPPFAWNGLLDEITLYCRALSQSEIQAIVAADSSGKCVPGTLSADLSVTKSDAPDPVLAGANITYTVTVNNNGPHPAASVTLTDAVPANTTFVSITAPAGWNVTAPPVGGTGTITATNPGVASCSPQVFTIVINVNIATPNGTVINNSASVSATTSDPNSGNNSASTTTTVNNTCSITCPANITVGTSPNQCSAVVNYPSPIVSGTCGTVNCTPASGSTFPKGTTTVTCTTQSGPTCTFTVTVNDTQAPSITCPGNISVIENPPGSGTAQVTYAAPTVSDNCTGVGSPSCNPPSGSLFSIGTTTVNCTVSDSSENSANCSFQVTVSNACAISCPGTITVNSASNQCGATVNYPTPTVTGNCGTVTCKPSSGSVFAVGTIRVNCTTTQGPSCSFSVVVLDRTLPQISCPSNVTAAATGGAGTIVNYPSPTISDNCSGVRSFCSPASGTAFPVGTTTVNCTASDNAGNSRSCSFTVTVTPDNQPPTITCPQNVTVQAATGETSAVVTYPPPTVTDNNPGATAVCVPPSGSTFAVGTTPVTCTATDVGGNQAFCTFSVMVQGGPPQGQVSIPGGKANVEFPTSPARRKPKAGPCSNFSITNTGQTPLILTFESILRTGADVTNGRITDPNEGDLYRLSRFNSNGTEIDVPLGGRVTIGVGETVTFCARFVPVLPRIATSATGLAAPFVVADVITSKVTLRLSTGSALIIPLLANVSTDFSFINPNNTKKAPQATFERQGNNYILTYSIFDSNLDVKNSHVELLDSSGSTVATFDVDLQQPLRDRNLVRGQSFTVEQRFTGANANPQVTSARVTVTDGTTNATLAADISSSGTALRVNGNDAGTVVALPPLRIKK